MLAGADAQVEIIEDAVPVRIFEKDILEVHAGASLRQGGGRRVVAQLVRDEQRGQRLRQPRHVLGHIDQRDREIAGGVQHRKPEGADQHHVARACGALLPQPDGPAQQGDGEHHGGAGMQQAQLLEIDQAAAPRAQLAVDGFVEAAPLAAETIEGMHERHVADDIDHFAVDRRRAIREGVMQRPAGRGQVKHDRHHDAADAAQHRGHRQADGGDEADRDERGGAWRQHVPDEHVVDGEHGIGRGGDAARQHARLPAGEVARRVTGQVPEEIASQVAGDGREGATRDPAGEAPEQVIERDQRDQQEKREPDGTAGARAARQRVDQELHAVLGADRAGHRGQHGGQDDGMRNRPAAQIARHEGEGTPGIAGKVVRRHVRLAAGVSPFP